MSNQTHPARDAAEILLIVEDSPTQAERLRYFLERPGYRVTAANNGRQAMAFLDEHKPALIISDIVMPEMTGYELCRRIKADARTRDIPVILLTALSNAEDVLEGWPVGPTVSSPNPTAKIISSRISKSFLPTHCRASVRARAPGWKSTWRTKVVWSPSIRSRCSPCSFPPMKRRFIKTRSSLRRRMS
jgi:CheY-like chemotaxis protein